VDRPISRRAAGRLLAAALTTAGCSGRSSSADPLRVASASDLQAAWPAVAQAFATGDRPPPEAVFGASGLLAEQVRQGAPFGLFLSASRDYLTPLADGGVIRPGSVRAFAVGGLALVVPAGSDAEVRAVADLAGPGVRRVAIANPAHAPYGKAAKQAIERAGIWAAVEPKVVLAESVRQALQVVESGEAEAGVIAGSLVTPTPAGLKVWPVDPALYDPVVIVLGVVAGSPNEDEADALAAFLMSVEGRAVLARFGFRPPPGLGAARPLDGPGGL